MPERIQRKRTKGWRMPEGTVYVGRPTKWGNPFHLPRDFPAIDGADIAVEAYRRWGTSDYKAAARAELHGKNLACWCKTVDSNGNKIPCHADVLLEWANDETSGLRGPDREDV